MVILLVVRKTLKRILVAKLVVAKAAKAAKAIRRSKTANVVDEVRRPKWAESNLTFTKLNYSLGLS